MSDLVAARPVIQLEETKYRSALSENVAQRLGKAVNMANLGYLEHSWYLQGDRPELDATATYVDGPHFAFRTLEIIGLAVYFLDAGSTNTEFDIKRRTAISPAGDTSIFSTKPKLTINTPPILYEHWIYSFLTPGNIHAPSATVTTATAPVLDVTNGYLAAGDAFFLSFTNLSTSMGNVKVTLFTRPRGDD